MVVSQAEIDQINSKIRRRMMRLPVLRGPDGELEACPLRRGASYRLQPRQFSKAHVTITVLNAHREKLAALSLADAKKEGHAGIQGALEEFWKTHGTHDEVWVVAFAKDNDGDVAALINQERPLYLARHGDYTLEKNQAVTGEPEVLLPFAEDLKRARTRATEGRINPQSRALRDQTGTLETLQRSLTDMKARSLVKRAQRHLEAAERVLLSGDQLDSPLSAAVAGVPGEADLPSRSVLRATPEAA